jgi:hypothetical protein
VELLDNDQSSQISLLRDISKKLSQLIIIFKISNEGKIKEVKKKIQDDPVARKILELADGSLPLKTLKERVMKSTKVSGRTVRNRIYELVDKGVLISNKKGNENYYENSGLFD